MHTKDDVVRLFLSSAARDGGTQDNPVFNLPNIASLAQKVGHKRAYVTVERVHVESNLTDLDETFVVILESHPTVNAYDAVTKSALNIIATVASSPAAQPGAYHSIAGQPFEQIPISGQVFESTIRLRFATLKTKSNVLAYYPPLFVDSQGNDTATLRDFYVVLRVEWCSCHD